MAKKKAKKSTKTKSKLAKVTHLVLYVEDSFPKNKLFKSFKSAKAFVSDFTSQYTDPMDGYWVDYLISDIHGSVHVIDGVEVEHA